MLTSFKARLGAIFKVKDLGDLSQLMGMHITRDQTNDISTLKSRSGYLFTLGRGIVNNKSTQQTCVA
jgi:hypothetical protein